MKNGNFIISLDFELYWGIFEKTDIREKQSYFENTLNAIPQILQLFSEYGIHATWASVGFLFFENMDELKRNLPGKTPRYVHPEISSYHYLKHRYDNQYAAYHFAPDLIKLIRNTPGQEIGSHTLSHYYCMEEGQTAEDFEADLQKHQSIAKEMNISMSSLVFPRNQHNPAYEKIIEKTGFSAIRSNPDVWFWNTRTQENLLKKIFRTADAYLPLTQTSFSEIHIDEEPVKIPASRFFRPRGKSKFLNRLRLRRIKKEMDYAAKNNQFYHLWWHPHNFGNEPQQALEELKEILEHYKHLKNLYDFKSLNMKDLLKF